MRTSAGDLALEQILTRERLGKYIQKAAGNLSDALTLYEANTKLSESFYGPLQCLEICLRNSLDQSVAAKYGLDWMDVGTCPIAPDGKQAIGTARTNTAGAAYLHDFAEEAKSSGLVASLIAKHKVVGLSVAAKA